MSAPLFPHRARKRFGQNFLQDERIIDRIVRAVNPRGGDCLVEIGPGQGAITAPLLAANGRLDVVELDRDLAAGLRARFGAQPGFRLHEGDVLKFDFGAIDCGSGRLRVLGNLPYNISTPLLFHLLAQRERIADMVFMLQLEVVQRLAAGPGDEHYGRLSVMTQYHCQVEQLFTVPPQAFRPQPKVDSAIVRLVPHHPLPYPAKDEKRLEQVLRTAFGQRRKTLRNALRPLLEPAALEALGINGELRPENLALADYVRISDSFEAQATTTP